ncbi:retrotransposon protein, putative, unclassified [Panicum miliaceum]|uniref:Retrotransposon protein, putative, unclassified n=1 Tax=Panicum miliaceum TaxID=4540 RepID=A0A3L6TQY2_PANMI|nr:retrotransposon protein, putative, unclassified [Panicum miliaceum]
MQDLDIQRETMNERYLGLPVYVGKSKTQAFSYLKERIWKRIQGWKEKMLSRAGKEVMIKAVAQAIPTFAMGCFDLTKELCDHISSMIGKFWWSQQEKENKIHWISWEKLILPKGRGGLGFRDIHGFNLAMLAKQGWRLVQNPESLCARILGAKYCPHGDLFKAKMSGTVSYTWRSIMRGIKVLESGVIWRVGNGEKINIWNDPWIPRGITRREITPRGGNLVSRVSELIDPVSGGWDDDLLNQTFWSEDVEVIKSIPVHFDLDDVLAWHFDIRGIFSVKSAYKVYRDVVEHESRRGQASTAANCRTDETFWKKLWKLNCPGKIKHFLWRLGHNSVAVRCNLKRRGMEIDTRCVMCNRLDEDGGHLFCNCKFVKYIWRELNIEEVRCRLANQVSVQMFMSLIWELEEKMQLRVVMLLWHWWLERNRVREGERRRSASELAFIIAAQSDEFLKIDSKAHQAQNGPSKHWCKPVGDTLKINVDGAFFAETKSGGWGYVIRDADGAVILAGAGITRAMDAFHTEVVACQAGLKAACEKGMTRIVLETDSMMLRLAMEGNTFSLAPTGGLVHEIKMLASSSFVCFSVLYCPRVCNGVAHALAARGCKCSPNSDLYWDGVPTGLENLVAEESLAPFS